MLEAGADPTLVGCSEDFISGTYLYFGYIHECARTAATNAKKRCSSPTKSRQYTKILAMLSAAVSSYLFKFTDNTAYNYKKKIYI